MLIDCHVHTNLEGTSKEGFLRALDAAGVDKAVLFSYQPASFSASAAAGGGGAKENVPDPAAALKDLMEWAAYSDRIVPMFWIDPLDEDAQEQVDRAVAAGVAGFKAICNRYYPGDGRPMEVWSRIAAAGKPILFHSGILYADGPCSNYNRPVGFEPLFDIPGLRFALAHVSWPWHDECLAVYGYWRFRRDVGAVTSDMFIDTCPGTPRIYREEVMRKIYGIGYDLEDGIMFGTDGSTKYDAGYTEQILAMDKSALDSCGATAEQREKYYGKNAARFLGL